jgi:hypothetical protein
MGKSVHRWEVVNPTYATQQISKRYKNYGMVKWGIVREKKYHFNLRKYLHHSYVACIATHCQCFSQSKSPLELSQFSRLWRLSRMQMGFLSRTDLKDIYIGVR